MIVWLKLVINTDFIVQFKIIQTYSNYYNRIELYYYYYNLNLL